MSSVRTQLAINGGAPVRRDFLPYGRQWIDDSDVAAVVEVLRSPWLTTGPGVTEFEGAFADRVGAAEAVAVSNGTAALHAAVNAVGIGPGDEVIVPALTFAATANCVVYQGASPVFADVDPDTLLLDPARVEGKISARTRAIIAVDYAGLPCDYDSLQEIADRHDLVLMDDACHALGGSYRGRSVGTLARLNTFSLHPVKHITSGEGGVVTTDDAELAQRMRTFRNHGITSDYRQREAAGSWAYDIVQPGYNYRLSDIQCALARSQLGKLAAFVQRRQSIASRYDGAFQGLPGLKLQQVPRGAGHAYHLYPVQVRARRDEVFAALHAENIGVNVHYVPVHLHSFYRRRLGTSEGDCPVAEEVYQRLLSLPIFPAMTDRDVEDVIAAVFKVMDGLGLC